MAVSKMLTPNYEERLISAVAGGDGLNDRAAAFVPAPSIHRPAWLLAGAVVILLVIAAIYDRSEKE